MQETLDEIAAADDSDAGVKANAASLNLDLPRVPRPRRPPRRLDEDAPSAPCQQTVEEYHRSIFFNLLENILSSMKTRFDQANIQFYVDAENLILSCPNGRMDANERALIIDSVCKHFGSDLDNRRLSFQLEMLHDLMGGKPAQILSDVTSALSNLGVASRIYSEVVKLTSLLLVLPASSATAERSFSCLRRVKTYLRATMGQERLNNLLVMNIHQDILDSLDLKKVVSEFVSLNDYRRNVFGNVKLN